MQRVSWLTSDEGESCESRCERSGAQCDLASLQSITSEEGVRQAAAAAGQRCTGGAVEWGYATNPGICTHARCCGDRDFDGTGDCENVCTYGDSWRH